MRAPGVIYGAPRVHGDLRDKGMHVGTRGGKDAPGTTRARERVRGQSEGPWGRLIHKVYEAGPLECPTCKAPMRIIALIDDPKVIRRILEHLGPLGSRGDRARPTYASSRLAGERGHSHVSPGSRHRVAMRRPHLAQDASRFEVTGDRRSKMPQRKKTQALNRRSTAAIGGTRENSWIEFRIG